MKIEAPSGHLLPGRGFYQLEEDVLQVQVGYYPDARRFFSYLESSQVRFDIDHSGRMIMCEVSCPRRHWQVADGVLPPRIAESADLRWLDFRAEIDDPELLTTERRDRLLIRFADGDSWRWFAVAENLFARTDRDQRLLALLVTDIEDDFAGRRLAAFRRRIGRGEAHRRAERETVATISG